MAKFTLAPTTRNMAEVMRSVPVGATATYADLAASLGVRPDREAKSIIRRARLLLFERERIVFETILGVGLKRAVDGDLPRLAGLHVGRAMNDVDRGLQTIAITDVSKLAADERRDYYTHSAVLGVLAITGARKTVERIAEKAQDMTKPFSADGALKIIGQR